MWDRGVMRELLRSDETHFTALTRDAAGNLYVGSAERGIVYRCSPAGLIQPIADLQEPTISALACDAHGNLYIGTTPAGNLYRLSPEGVLKPLYPHSRLNIRHLLIQGDTLYALTRRSTLCTALRHIKRDGAFAPATASADGVRVCRWQDNAHACICP
jgi:hypothetical protein